MASSVKVIENFCSDASCDASCSGIMIFPLKFIKEIMAPKFYSRRRKKGIEMAMDEIQTILEKPHAEESNIYAEESILEKPDEEDIVFDLHSFDLNGYITDAVDKFNKTISACLQEYPSFQSHYDHVLSNVDSMNDEELTELFTSSIEFLKIKPKKAKSKIIEVEKIASVEIIKETIPLEKSEFFELTTSDQKEKIGAFYNGCLCNKVAWQHETFPFAVVTALMFQEILFRHHIHGDMIDWYGNWLHRHKNQKKEHIIFGTLAAMYILADVKLMEKGFNKFLIPKLKEELHDKTRFLIFPFNPGHHWVVLVLNMRTWDWSFYASLNSSFGHDEINPYLEQAKKLQQLCHICNLLYAESGGNKWLSKVRRKVGSRSHEQKKDTFVGVIIRRCKRIEMLLLTNPETVLL